MPPKRAAQLHPLFEKPRKSRHLHSTVPLAESRPPNDQKASAQIPCVIVLQPAQNRQVLSRTVDFQKAGFKIQVCAQSNSANRTVGSEVNIVGCIERDGFILARA
jgi:hypothetical protein